jgi:uncharacterized protein (DUF58 family)
MIPRDVLRQVRRLQFRARRAVEEALGGQYRSVFKGSGLIFEDVREYQPGDDVRPIDWNVTARMGHPYVKRYVEERERTFLLAVDWSGSQLIGSGARSKRDVAGELAAILAFCAVANNDRVGLLAFTDRIERYLPPRKALHHVLRLLRDILYAPAVGRGTSIAQALDFLARVQRRRAIVFVFSDFLDRDYEPALRRAARKHDVVAVRIWGPRDMSLPDVGLIDLIDAETGKQILLDTKSRAARSAFAEAVRVRRDDLRRLAGSAGIDLIDVDTEGGHLDALLAFFRRRRERVRRP